MDTKNHSGTIRPRRRIVWVTILSGLFLFFIGISAIDVLGNARAIGYLLAFIGGCFTLLSIPNLTKIQNLNWTNESVDGPKAIMRLSRNKMKWSEIEKIGILKGSIYYIEDRKLERIYWSRVSYEKFNAFEDALKQNRPALKWPKSSV